MKKSILMATLLALVISGAFPAVFAAHLMPFKGSMSGSGVATSQATNAITADAHVTSLGKTALVGVTTVTGFSECGGFVGTEQDTLTAANGDKVSIVGDGHSCVGSAPNIFDDIVSFTITGGTGRFAHASGSGTIHTIVVVTSLTSSTFTATIDGTLTI